MRTLILYDLMILRRSGAAAFARKRDILLLLVAVPIGLLLLIERGGEAAASIAELPATLTLPTTAAIALAVNLAVANRLAHLREECVVARQALRPAAARVYALFWNLPPLAAGLALSVASGRGTILVPTFLLAYFAGIALAAAQKSVRRAFISWAARRRNAGRRKNRAPLGERRRQRLIELLLVRMGLFGPSLTANLVGFAAIGAVTAAIHLWLSSQLTAPAAAVIAGTPMLLLLILVLLRTPPSLLRYLLYLGDEPTRAALVATALAAALTGGLTIGALATGVAPPLPLLTGAVALPLVFLALAMLRTLHFATKSRQTAEIAVQLDLAAAALVGLVALPLAPALLVVRLWMLARRARAMRYLAP